MLVAVLVELYIFVGLLYWVMMDVGGFTPNVTFEVLFSLSMLAAIVFIFWWKVLRSL